MAESTQGDLELASGVWFALARDLSHGVFYRDLVSTAGYGGTRYFPLFFSLLGGLYRLGLSTIVAGALLGLLTAAVLVGGLARLCRAMGLPALMAATVAVGGLVPYFVLQTIFAVRGDAFAAACNLWGLAYVMLAWRAGGERSRSLTWASVWFTLALATKVTSLAVPGAVVVAFALAGRWRPARRLAVGTALGTLLVVGATIVLSDGRALVSWRACMFAGASGSATLAALWSPQTLEKVLFSHLLRALLVLDGVALLAATFVRTGDSVSRRETASGPDTVGPLVVVLFAVVTASTWLILSSPGTTASNQAIEWIEVSFVLVAGVAQSRPTIRLPLMAALAAVFVYAAAQNLVRAHELAAATGPEQARQDRARVAAIVETAPGPVLFESALWPSLVGSPTYVIDPFALRVVMTARPEVFDRLAREIDTHVYARIVLQYDPTSEVGGRWYHDISFGWPIAQRILQHYRLSAHPTGHTFVYVPSGS